MPAIKTQAKRTYHHGDLRAALLEAAEQVLADKGVESFTMRECARRAGVSHAAPAHHFKDVTSLLTAMATVAFERLTAAMREAKIAAPADPTSQLRAAGVGYVRFARENPQHFRLMFRCSVVDEGDPVLKETARGAFMELVTTVSACHGIDNALEDQTAGSDVMLLWSMVHGFAYLYLENQLPLREAEELDMEALVIKLLDRVLPALFGAFEQQRALYQNRADK